MKLATIHIEQYSFMFDPVTSPLALGNTDASVEFTIAYTPPSPELYNNPSAYVAFNSISFDPTGTKYHMDYNMLEITSTYVKVKINKYGDSRLRRLKGFVIIIAQSAAGKKCREFIQLN